MKLFHLIILWGILIDVSFGQSIEIPLELSNTNYYSFEKIIASEEIPWGIAVDENGIIYYTELNGTLNTCKNGICKTISGIPKVRNRGQGGLMDIALHPLFNMNKWIYLSFSEPDENGKNGNTSIIRGTLANDTLVEVKLIYRASPPSSKSHHYGSRMVFDKAGYLYFSIGDRGNHFENPQDLSKDGGKIYRVDENGVIPNDNPFYSVKNSKTATFSYGHRNQQGLAYDENNDVIWSHEHGPQGGDEINVIKKGVNYGWPVISYGIDYDNSIITDKTEAEGMEQPIFYYKPSIAPSGLVFINKPDKPNWHGNLLIGSLKFQYLERVILDSNNIVKKREKMMSNLGRVRSVHQGFDGKFYVGIEGQGIYLLNLE